MSTRRRLIFGFIAACLLASTALFFHGRILPSTSRTFVDADMAHADTKSLTTSSPQKSSRTHATPRAPVEDQWDIRWKELLAQPEGETRDKAMMALLEELAATDPMRAITLADGESNLELRDQLLQAALRGWGDTNPEAAVAWASSQTLMDQGQAVASAFHGAARDPENLFRLTAELSAQNPERAGDYGSYLVAALNRAGEFNRAAAYAADAPTELRTDLLNAAYAGWGDRDPKAAMKAVVELSDPETKRMAFDATISRWADNDAKAATEYALGLPDGREKTFALSVALRAWAASDAVGAATWAGEFDPSPELDYGVAVIASLPETLQQPQVATSWAESIVDPKLRVRVLATVVKEWAATDPVAARSYAEKSPNIRPEDRAPVLSAFDKDFNPVSLVP